MNTNYLSFQIYHYFLFLFVSLFLQKQPIPILSISLPASIATPSRLKGESPLAISSALTNSFTSKDLGRIVFDTVVYHVIGNFTIIMYIVVHKIQHHIGVVHRHLAIFLRGKTIVVIRGFIRKS